MAIRYSVMEHTFGTGAGRFCQCFKTMEESEKACARWSKEDESSSFTIEEFKCGFKNCNLKDCQW